VIARVDTRPDVRLAGTDVKRTAVREERELTYMPQFDALRAFAVTAVLIHHYLPSKALPGFLAKIPWGTWGVHLFFVLSGFLITGILLRARAAAQDSPRAGGSRSASSTFAASYGSSRCTTS
jgi:peptidoglycan/LPS O-acetylase OafA/YrhL